jgi:isoquinoline 1-oxidoreductase beta subunit
MDFKPYPAPRWRWWPRPPVFGAKVAKFDAAKAKAIKGVIAVLAVPTDRGGRGVAVIADGYWPAKQGRDALQVEWDSSAVEKVSSDKQLAEFKALSKTPACRRHQGRHLQAGGRAEEDLGRL